MTMKSVAVWCASLFLVASSLAQTTGKAASPKKPGTKPALASKSLQELKTALEEEMRQRDTAMQAQIQELKDEIRKRDVSLEQAQAQIQQLQTTAAAAQAKADQMATQADQQQTAVSTLRTDVSDLKQDANNVATSLQDTQQALNNPVALHFKGITITPGGFLAAETAWHSHALAAGLNTPFNSVPLDGATDAHLSEFFGSGRQSRVSMLAEGRLGSAKLTGYVEADFLSAGITSNNNQSNSYSLRQRQVWGQAALDNGWSFTGGQMWSLVTETKKGVDNRTEALPMTIDPQYTVGFSWARQYGFRVAKSFGSKLWWAAAVENPQATLGGHLAPGQNNFVIGSQGSGSGLYNSTANYSFNPSPDVITKVVIEPGRGLGHYEVFGVLSDFRDRIFPCGGTISASNGVLPPPVPCGTGTIPNSSGAYNNSGLGKGVGANARITLAGKFDLGAHLFGGEGIGRYGTAGLPDVVARPDGVLVPVRNYQGLATAEWHSKKLDIYANVGAEYEARTAFTVGGKGAGYGSTLFDNSGCYTEAPPSATVINVDTPVSSTGTSTVGSGTVPNPGSGGTPLTPGFNPANPPNCTGDTRSVIEGTIGFWYRLYSGPRGKVQWGPQYSYIDRNTWSGIGGNFVGTGSLLSNPSATENLFLTSFRYYLP